MLPHSEAEWLPASKETLNQSHQIIIVAAELDPSTERIIGYLNARDIAINVVFFQVFEHGAEKLLSRAWLIDPGETQANVASTTTAKGDKEPWNGEFYVSFGDAASRNWEDAQRFGFISDGGGSWYSQTLKLLSPGPRGVARRTDTGLTCGHIEPEVHELTGGIAQLIIKNIRSLGITRLQWACPNFCV